jgi:TolA-binding protein
MNSTPNTKDVLIARADEQLARVRERIASADDEIARVTEQLSKMERDDAHNPSAGPGDDARNPSATSDPQPPRGKSAVPGSIDLLRIGLLLAACVVVAALVSHLSRDGVALIGASWTPQRVSPPANPPLSAQPGPSFELTTAETAPAQAAPLARTGPQDAAPAAAGVSELMQLQQATARDVANLKREIEQLKVKQDQIATDNSKAIEQLKAKQEDMARLRAQASEQSALPMTSPPSAGPTQSPQARMRPRAPPPRRQYPPRWQYYDDEW